MRITTKTRYAVTAMLDLAIRGSGGRLTLADISEKQGVSLSYLEQLFSALRAKGLVRGVRGPGGGYSLGKEPEQISVADIICAVDDWVEQTIKRLRQKDKKGLPCTTRNLWEDLSEQMFQFVEDITLDDLLRRSQGRGALPDPRCSKKGIVRTPALASLPTAVPGTTGRTLTV